jgi:acyl dehydratase
MTDTSPSNVIAPVRVGDEVTPQTIDVTTSLIVTGAIASRDFYIGHHDAEAARLAGSKDVFMNIMTSAGLVSRFITDWAGCDSRLISLQFRLGAPNYPGDQMILSGSISEVQQTGDGQQMSIDFTGRNSAGIHIKGAAVVSVPGLVRETPS